MDVIVRQSWGKESQLGLGMSFSQIPGFWFLGVDFSRLVDDGQLVVVMQANFTNIPIKTLEYVIIFQSEWKSPLNIAILV